MKKSILLLVTFFTVVSVFAQEAVVELDPSFSAIKSFFLPSIAMSALVLWSDTVKHLKAGTWEFGIFLSTKMIPFAITNAIAIAIYLLLSYLPFTKGFIEILAGSSLAEVTAASLVGAATAIVDGLMKKKA